MTNRSKSKEIDVESTQNVTSENEGEGSKNLQFNTYTSINNN